MFSTRNLVPSKKYFTACTALTLVSAITFLAPAHYAKAAENPASLPQASPKNTDKTAAIATGSTESIVVIGQKLGRLQNTNSAITVLKKLDSSEYRSLYDVVNRVPNMIGNAADIPTIRGVTGSGAGVGFW